MKRYKLLKDLPTFNKGDIFRVTEHGNLMREKDGVIAYAKITLEEFNILDSDWFEEIPEEYKRWRADRFERYWYVSACGAVGGDLDNKVYVDNMRYGLGNHFKTEEEAKKAAEWLKAFTTLRDDAKGFKPDWKNEKQKKWCVFYNHYQGEFHIEWDIDCHFSTIIFATKEDAEASIKNHEKEWLTYFGIEDKEKE